MDCFAHMGSRPLAMTQKWEHTPLLSHCEVSRKAITEAIHNLCEARNGLGKCRFGDLTVISN
ncbi:MAG: hypothetical protein J6B00_01940, partial [Alphaproteobacteria bacterium]|nr:hypothetical protein [Alphaproteobacteria bacterium]